MYSCDSTINVNSDISWMIPTSMQDISTVLLCKIPVFIHLFCYSVYDLMILFSPCQFTSTSLYLVRTRYRWLGKCWHLQLEELT